MWEKKGSGGSGVSSLSQLIDVDSAQPQNGQTLVYSSVLGKWVPSTQTVPTPTSNRWAGKKFNFLGDSITYGAGGSKTFPQYLLEDLQLAAARNYGVGGTTVSDRASGFYGRVAAMDVDADAIFILGGTNDFSLDVELGTLYTLSGTTKVATTDTTTFYGAYHKLAQNLINKYPTRRIVFMTPLHRELFATQPTDFQPNTKGYYLEDYVDAVIKIGKWYGIPVCDLYAKSGLQPNNAIQKPLYFNAGEGLHPNNAGYQRIAQTIEGFLNTLY